MPWSGWWLLRLCSGASPVDPQAPHGRRRARLFKMVAMRQYQVVGRKAVTEKEPNPAVYRMKVFAPNEVTGASQFWYLMHQMRKMKKTTGEILDIIEIKEKNARIIKNYGIWLRYDSRSGTHNMYREYRDLTLTGAVDQMYSEMAGRHRCRPRSIQIIRTGIVKAADTKRPDVQQFHNANIKFPLTHRLPRAPKKKFRTTFKASRPTTFLG